MRVPSFERFGRLTKAAAIFCCGGIVGAAVFNGIMSDQLNRAIIRNYELRDQTLDLETKLDQANRYNKKQTAIKTIKPFIEEAQGESDIDVVTEAALKNKLKEDLSIFLGRSIYEIDSDAEFARKLLRRKIYTDIGDRDYEIAVKTVLVVEQEMQIWVEAKVHLRQ